MVEFKQHSVIDYMVEINENLYKYLYLFISIYVCLVLTAFIIETIVLKHNTRISIQIYCLSFKGLRQ